MELVEKVVELVKYIEFSDDGEHFVLSNELIDITYAGDSDLPIIKEKLNNLVQLMTTELEEARYEELLDRDFETDIWFLI